jgi:hypothetical protein
MYIHDIMTGFESYFEAHEEKIAAYELRYQTVDEIVNACWDVEAEGE